MNINNLCVDIILCISSTLFINNLRSFILLDKSIYSHKYAILGNNKDIIKYMLYDTATPYYYIIFDNTYANINANWYDYIFNEKELYSAANILSYYVSNKVIRKEVADIYLLNIFVRTKNNNYCCNENIAIRKIKNRRIKLCCKLFSSIFNYNWENLNINLYDLFNCIYYIVYKRYNNIYDVLYNIRIHKSLEPLKTLYILIGYEKDITDNINNANDVNDANYIMIGIYKYTILYIIFNYIENIQDYIVKAKFNLLIQVIVNKCIEIEGILIENNYLPNKLKLLVLSKISKVYNIFADVNV